MNTVMTRVMTRSTSNLTEKIVKITFPRNLLVKKDIAWHQEGFRAPRYSRKLVTKSPRFTMYKTETRKTQKAHSDFLENKWY